MQIVELISNPRKTTKSCFPNAHNKLIHVAAAESRVMVQLAGSKNGMAVSLVGGVPASND